jgi:hypothetical protein
MAEKGAETVVAHSTTERFEAPIEDIKPKQITITTSDLAILQTETGSFEETFPKLDSAHRIGQYNKTDSFNADKTKTLHDRQYGEDNSELVRPLTTDYESGDAQDSRRYHSRTPGNHDTRYYDRELQASPLLVRVERKPIYPKSQSEHSPRFQDSRASKLPSLSPSTVTIDRLPSPNSRRQFDPRERGTVSRQHGKLRTPPKLIRLATVTMSPK